MLLCRLTKKHTEPLDTVKPRGGDSHRERDRHSCRQYGVFHYLLRYKNLNIFASPLILHTQLLPVPALTVKFTIHTKNLCDEKPPRKKSGNLLLSRSAKENMSPYPWVVSMLLSFSCNSNFQSLSFCKSWAHSPTSVTEAAMQHIHN